MGANQSFACRQSGAWTTYKIALLCFMACALSGCIKFPSYSVNRSFASSMHCGMDPPYTPLPVDHSSFATADAENAKRLTQCISDLINAHMRSTGTDKKSALEQNGFSCPKRASLVCYWTVETSQEANKEDVSIYHGRTEINVDLAKKSITISKLYAADNGHFVPVYTITQPF